ncbi:hypothetical protein F5Y19DRAFT_331004 [Xylariaceae sp. FL1651]|nr:hypothetical protein F5Y19DRAFT_331004 [Xylariaceae sp. FL1651]
MDSNPPTIKPPFKIAPISGITLFGREVRRREGLRRRGDIPTGCAEIDDVVLLGGGFERGCVVGVSAEDIDFGMLLGLQTVARELIAQLALNGSIAPSHTHARPKAAIITTVPATAILPMLHDVIRAQVQARSGSRNLSVETEVRQCLEAISISRVFDVEGLWEVLHELEAQAKAQANPSDGTYKDTASIQATEGSDRGEIIAKGEDEVRSESNEHRDGQDATERFEEQAQDGRTDPLPTQHLQKFVPSSPGPVTELPPLRIGPEPQPRIQKLEILDSEDEEEFSSSPAVSPPPAAAVLESLSASHDPSPLAESGPSNLSHTTTSLDERQDPSSLRIGWPPSRFTEDPPLPIPDIILVTHFSSLLTTLFTHRDKTAAHTTLQPLISHLRYLARSSGSLIILLNTTTLPFTMSADTHTSGSHTGAHHPPVPVDPEPGSGRDNLNAAEAKKQHRPLDPTLRSIFNPGPSLYGTSHSHTNNQGYGYGSAAAHLTRRNKPAFGATFAQFLDLHLLCTQVPRLRGDAEAAVALGASSDDVRYAWVVEVLLDELGFWDWDAGSEKGCSKDEKQKKGFKNEEAARGERGEEIRLPPPRTNREQRWGAVDVRDGVRVVNSFTAANSNVDRGPIRLAAGFGGRRV